MKLLLTPDAIQNPSAPHKVEIVYKDGTKKIEDYVVDYTTEIAIYESNIDTSPRKYTLYPWDISIESIRWLDE